MTIMLAGGMVIAAPSMVPEAAAAGSLYVSAENAMFENTFGGAQIVEVVVIDQNRSRTDIKQGEPVVKVDENQLRMAQGVDGNWYGYFGDKTKVAAADDFANNLDFGTDDNPTLDQGDFNEASNVYQSTRHLNSVGNGTIHNYPVLSAWNGTGVGTGSVLAGTSANFTQGQIGVITTGDWPFIQLYDFTTANDSSGHRLRVAEGDTVTAEYEDNTLPEPYTTAFCYIESLRVCIVNPKPVKV
jgi:hypothetical protein